MEKQFFTKKQIKARGWTDKLIEKYLTTPDKMEVNPFYPNSHSMHQYESSRVMSIENSSDFQEDYKNRKKRAVRKAKVDKLPSE